jgi:1-pyrroline-5-carboxylate dehydrogenase
MHFVNEPFTNFSDPSHKSALESALNRVHGRLGLDYPLYIDGRRIKSRRAITSLNPSHAFEIVGKAADASKEQASDALEAAARAFPGWSAVSAVERAALVRRIAGLLRERKAEFCAWLILEVGKNWTEADADVAEAIDFCDYYAMLAIRPGEALSPVKGESNVMQYMPLGPVVVVPPWNFPLAILVGMAMAAVVTGNTVVVKPSSQSPVIAAQFAELVHEAGLPKGVFNLVSGAGAAIGDLLVSDRRTRMVAFTGSKAVGLHINALAATPSKGQRWIKRVIAEMGGKNAIIVDESADLEAAVDGVLASAFGFQGQKCSACSRAYIHRSLYDAFRERLVEKVKAIRVGAAEVQGHYMGPVISESAMTSILRYMALAKSEGRVLVGGGRFPNPNGFYLAPTVVEALPNQSRLWSEEIFGPVLALKKINSFEEGLRESGRTEYGLTGAVFSRNAQHLERARQEFFCGNLYLNRKCTGALVGGHPFGGFNLSGTDSKAGGPDYLLLFQQAKVISERA